MSGSTRVTQVTVDFQLQLTVIRLKNLGDISSIRKLDGIINCLFQTYVYLEKSLIRCSAKQWILLLIQ